MQEQSRKKFVTGGGIEVVRSIEYVPADEAFAEIYRDIDCAKGCIFASDYEYPGRYSRWDIGFIDPPLEFIGKGRDFVLRALGARGRVILPMLLSAISQNEHIENYQHHPDEIIGCVRPMPADFPEEKRSKQPSVFSVLRALYDHFSCEDEYLSMLGAFGYDLVFQFEPINFKHDRSEVGADCHLFLADSLSAIDHQKQQAFELSWEFCFGGATTAGIPIDRPRRELPKPTVGPSDILCDHNEGEYAGKVEQIRHGCKMGDFFEVVLSQVFSAECSDRPSDIFKRLRLRNPSPYDFLINLGDEQLVGASPEMFVRVDAKQVETCPISGTVQRGESPMEDAEQILLLLSSEKDESELTMCTDVDRNDKSRVCVPGSVHLHGRRIVESYSRLFHTVDHVKGRLLDDCDMFDAFLSHMWACTLTGAPKPTAMQTIENLENSPRLWYGGCVGLFTFNGQLNTGITIRTIHLKDGIASVRAGATLLFDSDPVSEEQETRIKASAFLGALTADTAEPAEPAAGKKPAAATKNSHKRILFVDNQDSFVHTLANYVRQSGVEVVTLRTGFAESKLDELRPDLVFISPGPGTPSALDVPALVGKAIKRGLPVFGVCLGHQGIAEHFGAELAVMYNPVHGKPSRIHHAKTGIFRGIASPFNAGRYHSLHVKEETLPSELSVVAKTDDGIVMALQHKSLPIASVQFHPESILTLHDDIGLRLISNVINQLT